MNTTRALRVKPLPQKVIEELKKKQYSGKLFNGEDLLYYPENVAPNHEAFQT
ncbi:hypothetical protein MUP77_09810 [Candidatus Bathyarchaeota archaeon]|nr:hypothetical protein [Candidatus Bathyarchaeota archaeon]